MEDKENRVITDNASDATVAEYVKFMLDPKNTLQCEHCPANQGFSCGPNGNIHPCGQFRCWVTCHRYRRLD